MKHVIPRKVIRDAKVIKPGYSGLRICGRGGKGGGDQPAPRIPVESPNTLATLTYLSAVDLLCEGPIRGLVDCGSSVYFNDTPFQNHDGTFNFTGTTVDMRLGYPDQTPMDGFPDVETPFGVGGAVTFFVPIIQAINDTRADQVRVTLSVQGLFYQNLSTGDTGPYSVSYEIAIRQVDGPWILYPNTLSGKTRSQYAWDTLIQLPNPGPWELRVSRVSADDTAGNYQSALQFAAYTVLRNRKYTYGDSVIVGTKTNAQAFGSSIPTRTFELYAKLCQIPTNYNPDLRTYDGQWDGTFKTDWTQNPAWVLYDLLVGDRYGLGRFIGPFRPDKWRMYKIGQYCDEKVPDGFGGEECRFTFNGSLPAEPGKQEQAFKAIQDVASVFRGMVFWGGGTIWAVADMPEEPVQLFTQADVIDGRFTYSGVSIAAIHYQALMTWKDPHQRYRAQVELVQDLQTNSWNQVTRQLIGCTSRGEAHRYGKWILDTERFATQTVTFNASWQHAASSPGDVIAIADPAWAGIRAGGRLTGVVAVGSPPTVAEVTLDAVYEFVADKTYDLTVTFPSGKIETRRVTNAAGDTAVVTVDPPFLEVPMLGSVWALSGDIIIKQFRVLAVKETSKGMYEFTALEHDPSKYDRIERDLKLETPISVIPPSDPLEPPTNLVVAEEVFLAGGGAHTRAVLSWTPADDPLVIFYEMQYENTLGGGWVPAGNVVGVTGQVQDLSPDVYRFRVRSGDAFGRFSTWVTSDDTALLGLMAPPPDVTGFMASVVGNTAVLQWDPVSVPNLSHYEIRYTSSQVGADWATAQIIGTGIPNTQFFTQPQTGTFMIKAVTVQDVESVNAALIVNGISVGPTENIVAEIDEDDEFAGTHSDTTAVPGIGVMLRDQDTMSDWTTLEELIALSYWDEGFVLTGTYTFADTFDLGAVYTSNVTYQFNVYSVKAANVMASWDTLAEVVRLSGADSSQIGFFPEMRTTNQDPTGAPTWSAWTALTPGNKSFWGAQFRLRLTTTDNAITPVVDEAVITIDMPDRQIVGTNINSGTGGHDVNFAQPFKVLTSLTVSADNMNSGDYYTITDKDEFGFTIEFFNAASVSVARTFDYVALGYGRST